MPTADFVEVNCALSDSVRAQAARAMFDVPPSETCTLKWNISALQLPENWNVGLIVGPSGSGKSTVLRHAFGAERTMGWGAPSVIDDFSESLSMQEITEALSAVGFNTIPAWLRPHAVLSTGEKFRVECARRILEQESPIIIDEFTSVVDRQVAQVGSYAVQKYARRKAKRLVLASCHYDIIDWLMPDWIFEPATEKFTARGGLQRRPELRIDIAMVPYETWGLFAPFHYMTADLHRAARCFALYVNERIASIAAVLYRPHPKRQNVYGVSRLVTLPDWQGLGLAMILAEKVGGAFLALGKSLHTYPAHPALIRSFDKSNAWALRRMPGNFSRRAGESSTAAMGGRPCAVFEYVGARDAEAARALLSAYH